MLNAIRCIKLLSIKGLRQGQFCVQEFWYFVPGLHIQPEHCEQSEIVNPALKKGLQVAKHIKLYTIFFCRLTRIHGLVVKVSRSE